MQGSICKAIKKLLAMYACVTSLIKKSNKTTDNASFYCGKNHQIASVEKNCCLPPKLFFQQIKPKSFKNGSCCTEV